MERCCEPRAVSRLSKNVLNPWTYGGAVQGFKRCSKQVGPCQEAKFLPAPTFGPEIGGSGDVDLEVFVRVGRRLPFSGLKGTLGCLAAMRTGFDRPTQCSGSDVLRFETLHWSQKSHPELTLPSKQLAIKQC